MIPQKKICIITGANTGTVFYALIIFMLSDGFIGNIKGLDSKLRDSWLPPENIM